MLDLLLCPVTHVSLYVFGAGFLKSRLLHHRGVVMARIDENLCVQSDSRRVLEAVTVLYGCSDVKKFLQQHLHHLLPHLVKYPACICIKIIHDLAKAVYF